MRMDRKREGAMTVADILQRFSRRHPAQQLSDEGDLRLEERLMERARIARELHDTLLQGFLSATMQLHIALDEVPDDLAFRTRVADVLTLMRQSIDDGRNAIQGLRSPQLEFPDLQQAFADVQQQLALQSPTRFRLLIEGHPR